MSDQPNVLLIVADQHNAKVLGHAGHPDVHTPNLDRLAQSSVRFTRAITQNPICTPSRVSFLSGQYCHNHGYFGLEGPHPHGLPNVLGHFKDAGYRTAAIGKVHCPEYWVENTCDVFHETCDCSIGGRSKAYIRFLESHGALEHEDHIAMSEFGSAGRQSADSRPSTLPFEQSQEGWIAAEGARFMQSSLDAGQPFFAHLSMPRPHQCTAPSEPFWSQYETDRLTLPPNAEYDMQAAGKSPHLIAAAECWRNTDWPLIEPKNFEVARRRKLHGYLGAVTQVDHAVGQILDTLDQLGIAENTIVIYTSDHGDYVTEHGNMEKAPGICSDAITRVPLLVRWPGHSQAGHVADSVVELVDIAPSLCELAGLDPMETADGRSFAPMLRGEAGDPNRLGVTENLWSKSVRAGRFRLVYYPQRLFADAYPDGFGELYDLEADPWEMRNLFFDPDHQATVQQLQRRLMDWLVQTTRYRTCQPGILTSRPPYVTHFGNSVLPDGKASPRLIKQDTQRYLNYL